jgi:autotransporter translocation and assembly factor TamB
MSNEFTDLAAFADEQAEQNAHQLRQQECRNQYKESDLITLANAMQEYRQKKDELEDQLKIINAFYDTLRIELIPTRMETDGVEKITLAGIGRISLTGDVNTRIIDKPGFFDWLRVNKLGDLVQETVMPSTLKAFIRRRAKDGKELPTDFVSIKPFTRASITKG